MWQQSGCQEIGMIAAYYAQGYRGRLALMSRKMVGKADWPSGVFGVFPVGHWKIGPMNHIVFK